MTSRDFLRRLAKGTAAVAAAAVVTAAGATAQPVQMVSHRYPALEFYAEKMRSALPGVEVNTQLMPHDKAMELATIAFSSKADTIDLVYLNDSTFLKFAKNGWLRPLDDLWEKYKSEFKLDDFADSVKKTFTYDGKLYVLPHTMNTQLFFYRKDLFEKAGQQPPKTIADYAAAAKSFNSPMTAGTISCLKPVDAGLNEAHWYMNTIGGGWFDTSFKPIFNNEKGVAAIEMMKTVTGNAQRGFTSAANDECSIALQQGVAVMGMQWATRAAAMDDPTKSTVIGKIDWVAPPQGKQRIAADGYAISAFTKKDVDTLFKVIATSSNEANMRQAAAMILPPRKALLNDPELQAKNRQYPASLASLEVGEPFPRLPEFYEVGEFITRRVLQAVTGEMQVKPALDAAAAETSALLKSRGYAQ